MAEEEAGFTFVDKRRTQGESGENAAETTAAEAPPASDAFTEPQDASEAGEAPDVYGLIGYCVSLLSAHAWQSMGLLADPRTGEARPDLAQAKVAVDAVGDLAAHLESAPASAVPDSLRRDLRTLLNDLRLNYVAQRDQSSEAGPGS